MSVKAIDPVKYPFYGSVDVTPADAACEELLTPGTVAVGDDLLTRLHLKAGRLASS